MSTAQPSWPRRFSPLKQISQVPIKTVQSALIEVFCRWGQPQALRVDNGLPFGSPGGDLPPVLSLWLIGMGVDVIWNRPRQPTDNAKVERMQGVTSNWAEPGRCASIAVLRQRLDTVAHLQRSRYRVRRLGGRTRAEAYPALALGGRRYHAAGFEIDRVLNFLAQGQWVRKVNQVGQIDFYSRRFSLGRQHRYERVSLRLDLQEWSWIVRDERGGELKRLSASFLSEENICGLSLSQSM